MLIIRRAAFPTPRHPPTAPNRRPAPRRPMPSRRRRRHRAAWCRSTPPRPTPTTRITPDITPTRPTPPSASVSAGASRFVRPPPTPRAPTPPHPSPPPPPPHPPPHLLPP